MQMCKADYVCLLNNDTIVNPNWLWPLVSFMEKNPSAGLCQPKVKSMREPSKFENAGASGGYIDIFGYPICRGRVFENIEEDTGQYNDTVEVFWACGVACFIRTSILKEIGYLDDNYFVYAEEVDMNWRAHLRGYDVFCIPRSEIYHWGKATTDKIGTDAKKGAFYEYMIHRNHVLILLKNYAWWNLLWVIPCKLMLEAMAFVAFFRKNRSKSWGIMKGLWWIMTHPHTIWKMRREAQKVRKVPDRVVMKKMLKTSVALESFLLKHNSFKDYEERCRW